MSSTAVAVRPIMTVDLRKIDYSSASNAASKYLKAVGMSEQFTSTFPGTRVLFKSGEYISGNKKDEQKKLKRGTQFVVNIPNLMLSWMKYVPVTKKDGTEINVPHFEPVAHPANDDPMKERLELGDNDKSLWDKADDGSSMDPWKPVAVFPIRKDGNEEVHHLMAATPSAFRSFVSFFAKVMQEMPMHPGQLPVVSIDSEKAEMGKGKDKRVWDVPVLEVVDWTDAIDADNPGEGGVTVTDNSEDVDVGEVVAKTKPGNTTQAGARAERVAEQTKAAEAPAKKAAPATAKPAVKEEPVKATATPKQKRRVQIDDDVEGEDF